MVKKFPYLGEYRSMKKHISFFFMSMIDNIIPVSIALSEMTLLQNPSYFNTDFEYLYIFSFISDQSIVFSDGFET